MQEPYPRAHSVMQTRSSSFQNKASKIFQKVSNIRGRLRLGSTKKPDDEHPVGPYMNMSATRQTRSMDLNMQVAKPYMSQPMLTIPSMLGPEVDNDRRDSYSSQSPDHSPRATTFTFANIQSKKLTERSSIERPSQHSVSTALIPGIHTAVVVGGRGVSMDGLPDRDRVPVPSVNGLPSSGIPDMDTAHEQLNLRYKTQLEGFPQITVSPSSVPPSPSVGAENNVSSRVVDSWGKQSPRTSPSLESSQPVVPRPSSSHSSSSVKVKDNVEAASNKSNRFSKTQKNVGDTSRSTSLEPKRETKRPTTSGSTASTITPYNARLEKDLPEIPPPLSIPSASHRANSSISSSASTSKISYDPDSSHSNIPLESLKTSNLSSSAPTVPASLHQAPPSKTSMGSPPNVKTASSLATSSPPSSFHLHSRFPPPPQISHSITSPSPVSLVKRPSTSPTSPVSNSASLPSRRPSVPQLTTILPGNRFSLSLSEGENASARLSPSIIIRQPAFPILHLPSLNGVGSSTNGGESGRGLHGLAASEGANSPIALSRRDGEDDRDVHHARMESRRKLRHMPELPMAGNDKPEEEDGNDTEDGEDDEDEDDDMSVEMEGEEDEDEDDHGRQSSLESGAKSLEISRPALPTVDISRIDLSFLDRPPSPAYNLKGKGKAQAQDDPRKTPTANVRTPRDASSSDYFSMTYGSGSGYSAAGPSSSGSPRAHPQTPGASARTPRPMDIPAPLSMSPHVSHMAMAMPMTPPLPVPGKPGLYKHASRSMLDIPGFGLHQDLKKEKANEDERVGKKGDVNEEDVGMILDGVLDHADGISKKGKERDRKSEVEVPSVLLKPKVSSSHLPARSDALIIVEEPREPRLGGRNDIMPATAPPHATQEHPHPQNQTPIPHCPPAGSGSARPPSAAGSLLRRRSMPTFNVSSPPPPYPTFLYPHYHHVSEVVQNAQLLPPPLEEGNETLPPYTNSIYLRAIMPRKMEFSKPGVQARDRKWRRVVCELEGTVFRVYRCPPALAGTGKVVGWWERKVGVGDVSTGNGIGGGSGAESTTVGINTSSSGVNATSAEERQREQERLRAEKLAGESGDAAQQTHTEIPLLQPKSATPAHLRDRSVSRDRGGGGDTPAGDTLQPPLPPPPPPTRSRLANLLKPSRPHHRSQSDVPNPPKVISATRSSFNLPRPSFGGSSYSSMSLSGSGADESITTTAAASNQSLSVSIPSSASSHGPSSASRSSTRGGMRIPATNSSVTGTFPPGVTCPEPDKNDLIKAYTLQNAESGLGNDYFKRKNVIRVRMEGEQFLLQAKDVSDVVEWIEGLHSATNIALDLDERPMPRGPLFPRRRRRRPRRTPENEGANAHQEGAESSTARSIVS